MCIRDRPLGFVFLLYWLFKKKNVNTMKLILLVIALSVALSFLGDVYKRQVGALHSHPHTQITYVVSGRFRFTIGGEVREVTAGDTMLKTDGVIHGCEAPVSYTHLDVYKRQYQRCLDSERSSSRVISPFDGSWPAPVRI